MSIIGIGKESYLFVNGIFVDHEIKLCENTVLLPITAEFDFSSASRILKSDIDYSIVVLSASNLYSQMKILADIPENLAISTWNSQWHCVLLGAIINNSVICNLQCDKPVELLKEADYLNITNYELHGIKGISKELTADDEEWIKNNYKKAWDLLGNDRFATAVHCMSTYFWHSLPRVQLSILWSGIEALFDVSTEISFRISLYIANFLACNDAAEAKLLFAGTRKLYTARSAAVHGGKIKGVIEDLVSESARLLNCLIRRCAEIKTLPNTEELVFPDQNLINVKE